MPGTAGTCALLLTPGPESWTCCGAQRGDISTWWWTWPMGWKGSADALFSFEMRCSSEPHCLQAACKLPASLSPVPILLQHCPRFAPQSSHAPCQDVHHAHPCSSFQSSEGCRSYLLWQVVFTVICETLGLTAAQDLHLDLVRKQISCPMRKCQDVNVKEAGKGKFISFYSNDVPQRFGWLWSVSLSSFIFSVSPLNKVNNIFINTRKFSVRNNIGYSGIQAYFMYSWW